MSLEKKIDITFIVSVLMLRTGANNSEVNDYIDIVNKAKYTSAADSSQSPKCPSYIVPESI